MVKRWGPWVLKGALSAGLIWWVMRDIDLPAAWETATGLDASMLALAVALMLAQIALGVVRWYVVMRALSASLGLVDTGLIYYTGIFFNIVLPGAVGGDAVRMWKARKAGLSLSAAVNSVMLERIVTVLGLVVLVAATQPLLLIRVPDIPGAWVFPLLTLGGVAGILVLALLDRLPASLMRWGLVRGLASLAADTRRLFFRPRYGLAALLIAVAGNVNLALVVYALAAGLDIDIHVLDCLVLVPPVILIITLPISIAGWGMREKAMQVFLGFVGVANGPAVVVSVLFGLITMATALPGGAVWLLSRDRPKPDELEAGGAGA